MTIRTYVSNHPRGVMVAIAVLVLVGSLWWVSEYGIRPTEAPAVVVAPNTDAQKLAKATADGVEPGFSDLAHRISGALNDLNTTKKNFGDRMDKTERELADRFSAVDKRVKAIEERPAFDFDAYRDTLRKEILEDLKKALPPGTPVSEFKALEREVVNLQGNFWKRSAG